MKNAMFKKATAKIVGFLGFAVISSFLHAASFDCSQASTKVEKLICADEPLSLLDEKLAAEYKYSIERSADKRITRSDQRAWLKKVRNVCTTTECLIHAYNIRIPELIMNVSSQALHKRPSPEAMAAAAKPFEIPENKRIENQRLPLTFKLVEGNSYPVCQPYVDMLNETKYREYPSCDRKLLPEYEQFKALEWVEVTDMKEKLKAVEDGVTMEYASFLGLDHPSFRGNLKGHLKNTLERNIPVYKTVVDIDGDGNSEVIYNRLNLGTYEGPTNQCRDGNYYYVVDSTINLDNASQYFEKRYKFMSMTGHNQIFLVNNNVYQSHWSGRSYNGDITIYNLQHGQTKICRIDIQ